MWETKLAPKLSNATMKAHATCCAATENETWCKQLINAQCHRNSAVNVYT